MVPELTMVSSNLARFPARLHGLGLLCPRLTSLLSPDLASELHANLERNKKVHINASKYMQNDRFHSYTLRESLLDFVST